MDEGAEASLFAERSVLSDMKPIRVERFNSFQEDAAARLSICSSCLVISLRHAAGNAPAPIITGFKRSNLGVAPPPREKSKTSP